MPRLNSTSFTILCQGKSPLFMKKLNWHIAEAKLAALIREHSRVDVYVVLNIIAPLRLRLHNGERSVRLYNQIMNLRPGMHHKHSTGFEAAARRVSS